MRKIYFLILAPVLIAAAIGSYYTFKSPKTTSLVNPFSESIDEQRSDAPLPLEKYSIPNLQNYPFQASQIIIKEELASHDELNTYIFEYQTMDKIMTGTINIPALTRSDVKSPYPVIIMIRGYNTPDKFLPGSGTSNAASVFAKNGYITIAPDFFGFGGSDPQPEDNWEARFIKPVNVIELLLTIQKNSQLTFRPAQEPTEGESQVEAEDLEKLNQLNLELDPSKIGIWGHSNGGQITLSVLEAVSQPIPSTVWAPVTAPFPYSILFFTRDNPDEGKESRAWLAHFEKDYDVFDFTITQHLDKITGPLQIHHGSADQEALQIWSDDFVNKIEQENERRKELEEKLEDSATTSAQEDSLDSKNSNLTQPIDYFYYKYPGADHNLQPGSNWNQALERDLEFFSEYL